MSKPTIEALTLAAAHADLAVDEAVAAARKARSEYQKADRNSIIWEFDDEVIAAAKAAYQATIRADQALVNAMVRAEDAQRALNAALAELQN